MLKTLTVLRTPDLLHVLASMGHGDEIALVDSNFPAVSMAKRLVRFGWRITRIGAGCMPPTAATRHLCGPACLADDAGPRAG